MVAHNPLTPKEHRSAYRRAELPRRGATRLYQGTHSFRVGKNLKGLLKLLKETIRDNIGHMLMITGGQGAPPGLAPPSLAPCPIAAGWHQAPLTWAAAVEKATVRSLSPADEDRDARLSRGRGGSPGSRRGPRT